MEEVEYHGKKFKLEDEKNMFRFQCDKCGKCCGNDITIILTPYDIIKMCKQLSITSSEFIEKYSYFYIGDESKFPICALKTKPKCVFNNKICTIYEARSLRCRIYPLGRVSRFEQNGDKLPEKFLVQENCSKIPFRFQKLNKINKYLAEQDALHYLEISKQWNDFVFRFVNSKDKYDKIYTKLINIIIGIAYDFDRIPSISKIEDINEKFRYVLDMLNDLLDNTHQFININEKEGDYRIE